MENESTGQHAYGVLDCPVLDLTPDAFAPFGTVIAPEDDGAPFSQADAQLDLSGGRPRFYAMRVPPRGLLVKQITRHIRTTQVLASVGGKAWFLVVAAPSVAEPKIEDPKAFRIPGDRAIMLYKGTWHAGPHFEGEPQSFFNLELADTNVVDHDTCRLTERYGQALRLKP